nr:MAG: ORF1 [Torque teno midi virus]
MPFWWNRRRKPWYSRWYKRRQFRTKRRKKRWPRRRRRKYRRPTRRRRRRRGKVRRKKKLINIKQWQPDRIVLCKIKGYSTLVMGAEGTQYLCFTNEKDKFTPPQFPAGGGFGIERYTLQYLYIQNIFRHNIWTKSNNFTDLCRYLRCKIILYRHPKVDFVVNYSRQPPFQLEKWSYIQAHPYQMLLQKHKKIVLSRKTKPNGKLTVTLKINPPKQMITKWFFQKQFAPHDLVQLTASAASFDYPRLGCCNENRLISIYYLNPQFFQNSTWGAATGRIAYLPYTGISTNLHFKGTIQGKAYDIVMNYGTWPTETAYYYSIEHDTGWFQQKILSATKVTDGTHEYAHLPVNAARYNPNIDDGKGNKVYLVSITGGSYKEPTDTDIIFKDIPLWLAFYGFTSYIEKKKGISFLGLHMFVLESKYIQPQPSAITKQYYPFIDYNFINGNNPYKAYINSTDRKLWFPSVQHQIETINSIVETGPYIPKLNNDRESTWELPYKYIFYFKWGGPEITDQQVADPEHQMQYAVPDTVSQGVQISNPLKQSTEQILHSWDYRRGYITDTAFKRMCENLPVDTSLESDQEAVQAKRKRMGPELPDPEEKVKKIKTCLLSLCEESTSQEETDPSPQNLLKLINQHKLKQNLLKQNIITVLKDLKDKQRMLQLTTGILD